MHVIANCRVISDYERKDPSELSLKVGDVVEVLKKGKYIWYGRFDDTKGFFPSRVVEIQGESSNGETENPLSSTAVVDSEKNSIVDSAVEIKIPMDSKILEETFKEIESTTPLEDKRRSRPKSAGRPPSQVFIKENILQRSDSTDNLTNVSDEESQQQHEETSTVLKKVSAVSQIVMELKQKPNLKSLIQKDAAGSSTITVEHATEGPAWMKVLPKKKVSVPDPIKPENLSKIAPWMQEVRKRREHKLSLQGDDDVLQKVGQEFRSFQESKVNHTSTEVKSFSKTQTTNYAITEETSNIQTKSESLETNEENSTDTSLTATKTKVKQTYSSPGNNLDNNIAPETDPVTDNLKNIKNSIDNQTSNLTPLLKTISNVVMTEVIKSPSAAMHTDTNASSAEQPKCIKDPKDNSEKIESPNEANVTVTVAATSNKTIPSGSKQTFEFIMKTHPEQPKLSVAQSTENKETSEFKNKKVENQTDIIKEQQPHNSLPQSSDKEKPANYVQLLLNAVETLEAQHKICTMEILQDIKKLEASFNLQNQEMKTFIEAMKVKLTALIETKH